MATKTETQTTEKPAKIKKAPPTLLERTKSQWSAGALRGKITIEDLEALEAHAAKLKALLS